MNCIWITWEIQRRNKGLSKALGWPLYEITFPPHTIKLRRYLFSIIMTTMLLIKIRPSVVVAQNPSIVLSALVILLKYILNYVAVIDAHNSGIFPLEGNNRFFMAIAKWIQRNSDLTIVTNNKLVSVVESNGGNAVILPDKIPEVPTLSEFHIDRRIAVAYICTYSDDEPFEKVFLAAKSLPNDVIIYVTGRYNDKFTKTVTPNNVKLTGFLPDSAYWSLLSSVDIIIDLTLRENCLVCGAYEAVALEKPIILSATQALMSYFNKGCLYVSPTESSILNGIQQAIKMRESLQHDIVILKKEMQISWENYFYYFQKAVHEKVLATFPPYFS